MAQKVNTILNYASEYSKVKSYLGEYTSELKGNALVSGDFAKIFFTGDGHIISHGIDYTPTFGDSERANPYGKGLVPASNYAGGKKKFLSDKADWTELSVAELPMATDYADGMGDNGSNLIYTAKQVYDFFQHQISAVDSMRFKGSFNADSITTQDGALSKICEAGDTYRVSQGGTFAGYELRAGDLLICIKDNKVADTDTYTSEYWMAVESNIDGIVEHKVNNAVYQVFSSQDKRPAFDIYAPTSGGTAGYVLMSKGNAAPEWFDPKKTDLLSDTLKSKIAGTLTVGSAGSFVLNALDGSKLSEYICSTAKDTWNININGLSAGTTKALSLGAGLLFDGTQTSFNGSADAVIKLAAASKTGIGGVIIDNRTKDQSNEDFYTKKKDSTSTDTTVSVDSNGVIYLTKENIFNALGFEPGNVTSVHNYDFIIGETASSHNSPDPLNVNNPYFVLRSTDENKNKTAASSIQFVGNSSLKVTGVPGQGAQSIMFELQTATKDTLGGIRVFNTSTSALAKTPQITSDAHSADNKFYGVELDSTGKAFVYVPWEDTNPAFNKILVTGGGLAGDAEATGISGEITADAVNSTFSLNAGNGINLVTGADGKSITINQNVWKTVSPTKMGYAPKMEKNDVEMTQSYYILSFNGADAEATVPTWNKLPSGAFKDTWRSIKVNDTQLFDTKAIDENGAIVGKALNFTSNNIVSDGATLTNHVSLSADPTTGNLNIFSSWRDILVAGTKVDDNHKLGFTSSDDLAVDHSVDIQNGVEYVSFELSWWNIDSEAREIVSDEIGNNVN